MANGLTMNGMISHAFAAIMTATVVMFPTPKDLWETITDNPLTADQARVIDSGVIRTFPANLSERTTLAEINAALDYCANNFASHLPVHVAECETLMLFATQRIAEVPSPENASLAQRLDLTLALYCRQQWAGVRQLNAAFDIDACRADRTRLADPA